MNTNDYLQSLGVEFEALKDRIRQIMDDPQWQTDGEWKESVLRHVLRRHLPATVLIGRGFVVSDQTTSSQIDCPLRRDCVGVFWLPGIAWLVRTLWQHKAKCAK